MEPVGVWPRAVSAADLEALLDDELYAIRQRSPDSFPKGARAYLDDWARPEAGWLRKYSPDGIDEPHFDATPRPGEGAGVGVHERDPG